MKQGQVRTRAVTKSGSTGEAASGCKAGACRCSGPRPGLPLAKPGLDSCELRRRFLTPRAALAVGGQAFHLVPMPWEPGLGVGKAPVPQGCSLPAAGLGGTSSPPADVQTRGAKTTTCSAGGADPAVVASVVRGWLPVVPRARRIDVQGAACSLPAGSCCLLGYLLTPGCLPEPEQNPIFGGRQ